MQFKDTHIADLKTINFLEHQDQRGTFCKTFHSEIMAHHGVDFTVRESFYSYSKQGVIRGMHFQYPPSDQAKIIYVPHGKIYDVAVDLRKGSATYGQHFGVELSSDNTLALYIPRGFAHGFQALEDNSLTYYLLDNVYEADDDSGVRYDSLGIKWPLEASEVSMRDKDFETLDKLDSPF